jgi:glycosidase
MSNWAWDPISVLLLAPLLQSSTGSELRQPAVRQDVERHDIWLELGVDGFRLDAVPYLIEREGTSCEKAVLFPKKQNIFTQGDPAGADRDREIVLNDASREFLFQDHDQVIRLISQ